MRLSLVACLLTATTLAVTSAAQAGTPERMARAAFHPSDPKVMVVHSALPESGGGDLFFSDDGGASFRLLCDQAIDPQMRRIIALAIAGDGKVLVAGDTQMGPVTTYTLSEGSGDGCTWNQVKAVHGRRIVDFAKHPLEPNVTFAITSDLPPSEITGSLLRRGEDGIWTEGEKLDGNLDEFLITSVDGGLRIYERITRGTLDPEEDGGAPLINWLVRVSDDEGQSWQEHPFEDQGTGTFRLLAVDPSNADRIVGAVVSYQDTDEDEVLVSRDRGATFEPYLTLSKVGGVAFAPDGRVYIGEAGVPGSDVPTGLFFAASLDEPPQKLADFPVLCLEYQATSDKLYACQITAFGSVDLQDGSFHELLAFTKVKDFVVCNGVDTASFCKSQLCLAYCGLGHYPQAPVCEAYPREPWCGPCVADKQSAACGLVPQLDAGTQPDAGSARDRSGCACNVPGQGHRGLRGLLLGALPLLLLGARRRR